MIGALVRRNFHHQRWLFASLLFGVFAMELFMVKMGAAFDGNGLRQLLEVMPPVLKTFIGDQMGEISFTAMVGYGFQDPAVYAMGLAFVVLAATVPAAERERGFLDLVLVRPLPRSKYLTATLVVLVAGAVLLSVVQLLGLMLGLALVDVPNEPHWTSYASSAGGQIALWLCFGGMALLLAAGASRRSTAVAWVVGLALVGWVVEASAGVYEPLACVRWLSPFHYFQPVRSVLSGPSLLHPMLLLVVFAVAAGLSFARFHRRDI